jgi:WD40 repeat protein/tRNA A-37 threonylcarbamoyl transferase component Bud32
MSLARAHDQLVGRSLGEFVLRERIGEGGYGAVYRAVQPALDREAVVKVLHPHLHASHAALERFLREAKLASKLDHPFAAHVYAFGAEPDGELWIAMELVRGTPLDQILKLQGPLPLERLVPLLDRICEVVHTAHEQGMVHRDLKPANVMVLARAGRLLPKLLDFGIAKGLAETRAEAIEEVDTQLRRLIDDPVSTNTAGGLDLTQRGALIGSPSYMAPEQWVDAGHVDARTDLYALGVLAYECLTGKPPFRGDTLSMIAVAHANEPVPPLGPPFPAALDPVFGKVLAKQADDRYADALAFAAAFRQAAGISAERTPLPRLDSAARDTMVSAAPQPIAEAVAALDASRNAHQARDAVVQIARTITRYIGLVAIACRSRVSIGDDAGASELLRALYRRPLSDGEWLELARQLTRAWLGRRDAYPIPELVEVLHERGAARILEELAALRDREVHGEQGLLELLEKAVSSLSDLLQIVAFLGDYPVVVPLAEGDAEVWMGVRRTQRTTIALPGKGLEVGMPALVDGEGAPVLSLAPLFQVAAPTPGAPAELFLFDGRDARGAKLVALPGGFEHHDDALWDWYRAQLAGTLDDTSSQVVEEKPPYRGLQAFSAEDGASFFGREKQVDAFVNRLQLQPLLAVVGRSGAGKSSFVQAGVIPALPRGWRTITMRPGPSPLSALLSRLEHAGLPPLTRAALIADHEALGKHLRADAAEQGPLLLVVDQLEEVFTLCDDEGERTAFAESLAAAARTAVDPVRVIFTLRDDFLVRTEQVPALRNRIAQGLQLLTVPVADDLRRIVVEPARRAGYVFDDPGLPREMVQEVADQPGALPLISFTAAKLWELRDRHFRQLTRTAYNALGGVGGALARHADVTLEAMLPEERALAREAFRHLVTTQNTRAVLTRKDLRQLLGSSDHADRLLEKLVAARLVVASENEAGNETIEIVHEALLSAWPRLVGWRHEDAEGARFREQLRSAAEQWHQRSREKGLLWRGDALADYVRWRARHPGPLTDREAAFASASLADGARSRRNRRLLLAGVFTTLVGVLIGLLVFNASIDRERANAVAANEKLNLTLQRQYEAQGRRLVLDGEPLQALAYLVKAAEYGARGHAHDFLVAEAIRDSDGELFEVHHDLPVTTVSFSSDGTRLVTGGIDRTARIWDARTGAPVLTLEHSAVVTQVEYAPDDSSVLTLSTTHAYLWDARTGQRLHDLPNGGRCATYSPDGTRVLTAGENDSVALWEVTSGTRVWSDHGSGAGMSAACGFSRDGSTIAVGDALGVVRIWDVATGKLLRTLSDRAVVVHHLHFVPGHARLVTTGGDDTAALWDTSSGKVVSRFGGEHGVKDVATSPDGALLATASADHTAAIWSTDTGKRERQLTGHSAAVGHVLFSPDGKSLVTTSQDRTAALWDAATGRLLARWRGHEDQILTVDFDPAGDRVATGSSDGTVIVWSVMPQQHSTWFSADNGAMFMAGFSPDGQLVVTTSADHTARVWNAINGRPIAALRHEGAVYAAVFAPNGRELATAADDGVVRIWDMATRKVRAALRSPERVTIEQVSWAPDGSLLATADDNGALRCWSTETGKLRFERRGPYALRSAAFSRSGATIVTSGDNPEIQMFTIDGKLQRSYTDPESNVHVSAEFDPSDTRLLIVSNKQTAKIIELDRPDQSIELQGHIGFVNYAAWSPDGALAITASFDGTARIWDATSGALLAILVHPAPVSFASFSPDGKRVVLVDQSGTASIHDIPEYHGTPAELAALLQCRMRYEVRGDGLAARKRDLSACRSGR